MDLNKCGVTTEFWMGLYATKGLYSS